MSRVRRWLWWLRVAGVAASPVWVAWGSDHWTRLVAALLVPALVIQMALLLERWRRVGDAAFAAHLDGIAILTDADGRATTARHTDPACHEALRRQLALTDVSDPCWSLLDTPIARRLEATP